MNSPVKRNLDISKRVWGTHQVRPGVAERGWNHIYQWRYPPDGSCRVSIYNRRLEYVGIDDSWWVQLLVGVCGSSFFFYQSRVTVVCGVSMGKEKWDIREQGIRYETVTWECGKGCGVQSPGSTEGPVLLLTLNQRDHQPGRPCRFIQLWSNACEHA